MKCQEKNRYSKQTVEKAAQKQRDLSGKKIRIYKCPTCQKWHMTHRKEKR